MIRYAHCPVCNSTHLNKILTTKDYTVSGELFEIWQCAHCSLRITQNAPPQDVIGRYYKSEDYISHTESSKGIINWLYLRVRRVTMATKKNFINEITRQKHGSLLDVGAGTGAFVHFMNEHGWQAEGIEPDAYAIARAAEQYSVKLHTPDYFFSLSEKLYDAITMWHVLEHVHDLERYMIQLKKLLKADGRLLIAVPNYTSEDASYYSQYWAAYDVPRHLYHFSPAAMHELALKHGFEIKKMQPMWFDSFYVSLLSEKYKNGEANLVKGFLNGLRSNSKAISNPRKASSVIYVLSLPEEQA